MLICNWKMFGNKALVQAYVDLFSKHTESLKNLIVCPPSPLLSLFPSYFTLGAQNCHQEIEGAFTGENSAKLLAELSCRYVLLGHSERRQYFDETNELVAQKAHTALANGLIPIVCVGSKAEDEETVKRAISEQLGLLSAKNIIIAYEPLWAIGTNKVPSPQHIKIIADWIKTQGFTQVAYGGSVNPENASEIRSVCDGLLIGRASLSVSALQKLLG